MSTITNEQVTSQSQKSSPMQVFRNRNFQLLWAGEGISLLGDQFYMIALPWLVLQLTGDALAVGTVLALGGIPRALFILIGGAIIDRFSPRPVMLVSNLTRMMLMLVLAGLVITDWVDLWMIYVLALLFGLADAFFIPAQSTIVPQVVSRDNLQTANTIVQGTMQVSLFLGPALAGALIVLFGAQQIGEELVPDMTGLGLAFGIDALTFLVSAFTLWLLRIDQPINEDKAKGRASSVLTSMRQGLSVVWHDVTLRSFFIMIAAANLFINGPIAIGIPVIADTRLPQGAAAFGFIMSAYGGGSLAGILLAGVLPRPPARIMGIVLGIIWSSMGASVAIMGFLTSTWFMAGAALWMGLANGYVVILFITWLQQRTPQTMLGRVMSVLMFSSVGLIPVSHAVAGALINFNLTWVFLAGGVAMTLLVLLSMLNPAVRSMELKSGTW